jgi:pimeloyl-ACP methyl ester carboxylesterase
MSLDEITRRTAALHPICADLDVRLETFTAPGGELAALVAEPGDGTGAATRGSTVLLVPGYTGSKEDFRLLLEPLAAAGHRVVALDQRGQHQSPGGTDPSSFTTDALAQDVLAVAEQLGPVHLVGHSFGGLVSRAAVLERPEAFRSLVLMCSGPAALTGPRVALLPLMRQLLEQGVPALVAAMDQVNAADRAWLALDAPTQGFLRDRMLAAGPQALIGMGMAITSEPDRVEELRATGLPVLVLHGVLDDAWTPEQQARWPAGWVGVRRRARRAHSPAVEAPSRRRASCWPSGLSTPSRRRGPVGGLRDLERPDRRAGRRGPAPLGPAAGRRVAGAEALRLAPGGEVASLRQRV